MAMAIAPRRKARGARPLVWLLPALVVSLVDGSGTGLLGFGFCPLAIPALTLVSLSGILLLEFEPRVAIASSLVWTSVGLMSAQETLWDNGQMNASLLLLGCAPIMVVLATVHHRTRTSGTE